MADLRSGDGIVGGALGDTGDNHSLTNGKEYTNAAEFIAQVDNSAWDFATACSSCHVGGGLTTTDKEGTRYSQRPTFQGDTTVPLNAYDYTVYEYWMSDGSPAHYVNDQGMNNHLNSDGSLVDDDALPATGKFAGFAPGLAPWAYPYDMTSMGVSNFMMPNVRELDCMFCHMEGYNNIISSVAVQMGALNAAPAMGAGLLNMFTQAYIPGVVETMSVTNPLFGPMDIAYLPGSTVARIKGNPPSDNCRLCHSPTSMENFSDMFDKFLAASPMEFNPNSPFAGPTGLAMPGYDLNAAFVNPMMATESPAVYGQPDGSWVYADGSDAGGPFNGLFPMALFQTYKNVTPLNPLAGEMGGKNQPGSGPIYFAGGGTFDQQALKKATIPFPRADFFKRGDIWDNNSQEVHHDLECAGCHMDTNALNKDQCDPGRGYARLGGVESGAYGGQDSRNSVKRCENCHVSGKNNEGAQIETYAAKNANAAHAAAGLTADIVTAYGTAGEMLGNHLDVIDCSVCHMKKQSMAVRALDCTSGNRYPTMIGFENMKGMMAMFTDPMGLKDVPADDPIFTQLGAPKEMFINEMQEWQPLRGWWENGPKTLADGSDNPDYRRKIYSINMITAILFDNNGDFDANGDLATGVQADAQAGAHLGFDPWIQRDLKTGMTFADTGFATVPVGFGDPMSPTNPYGSVYSSASANGFNPNTGWDYVGVYGGNIMFTNPEQINAYQDFRTTMDPAKPWNETKLTIFGGPFQVTHNSVETDIHALGKATAANGNNGCNDCHAAGSDFFSGGYDMTGTAVPTADSVDFNGNGVIETAAMNVQMDGVTPATGPDNLYVEEDNLAPYNMMQRPVIDYEIVADAADLITGAEAQSKDGVVHEVEFEEHGCWDSATKTFTPQGQGACTTADYARTKDMSRAEFLYFDEGDHSAIQAKVDALEAPRALADIVADPVAAIATVVSPSEGTIIPVDVDPVDGKNDIIVVRAGEEVVFNADETVNTVGDFTYRWWYADIVDDPTTPEKETVGKGPSVTRTFDSVGLKKIYLRVINADGAVDYILQKVWVKAAAVADTITIAAQQSAGNIQSVQFDTVDVAHDQFYIIWGDGTKERIYAGTDGGTTIDGSLNSITVDHQFKMYSKYINGDGNYEYKVNAYIFDGARRVQTLVKRFYITP